MRGFTLYISLLLLPRSFLFSYIACSTSLVTFWKLTKKPCNLDLKYCVRQPPMIADCQGPTCLVPFQINDKCCRRAKGSSSSSEAVCRRIKPRFSYPYSTFNTDTNQSKAEIFFTTVTTGKEKIEEVETAQIEKY